MLVLSRQCIPVRQNAGFRFHRSSLFVPVGCIEPAAPSRTAFRFDRSIFEASRRHVTGTTRFTGVRVRPRRARCSRLNSTARLAFRRRTYLIDEVGYVIDSLSDNQQYDAHDGAAELGIGAATWPLFGQVWPTSVVMAMQICKLELAGRRVLEIGCGLGLCSIVLHKMGVDITASDYHPRVREFLDRNVVANGLPPIRYQTGDWGRENPRLGKFDVMIGSDILYEPEHARLVAGFIDRHSSDEVEVLIGDPGRDNRARFTRNMLDLGYRHRFEKFDQLLADGARCRGRISHYRRGARPGDRAVG